MRYLVIRHTQKEFEGRYYGTHPKFTCKGPRSLKNY